MIRHITGTDIFEVYEEYGEGGIKSYRLRTKSGKQFPDNPSFLTKDSAEWEADRWVRKFPEHPLVVDAIFERDVLEDMESREGFDPSSSC